MSQKYTKPLKCSKEGCGLPAQKLATKHTLEGPLKLTTKATLEGPFAGVGAGVPDHVAVVSECLATVVAFEGFVPCVCPHVLLQSPRRAELLSAQLASGEQGRLTRALVSHWETR